jgi:hypothetical protein
MEYLCEICNKKYKSYQSLWNHNKKFHPKPDKKIEYICKYCKKTFDNKYNKYYHQKKCNNLQNNKDSNIPINEPLFFSEEKNNATLRTPSVLNEPYQTELDKLNSKAKLLNELDNKIVITNNNINNVNSNNINSNNKTIIINNYNSDNIEYITEQFKDKLFKHLLDDEELNIPLPKLIESIKFNPYHKENNNVKIKSDRSKIGFYYDENKWKAMNKNELLDDLCNYSLKIFSKYFEEKKNDLSEDIINQYKYFSQITKVECELRNKIKEKIENIAYIFTLNNNN